MEQNKRPIKINMFGKFEILVGGNEVLLQLRQAKKMCLLLEGLILNKGNPVSHEEIVRMLWPENENKSPETALRTLLHRFRSLVDENGIPELKRAVLTNRGSYQWNNELNCVVDVFQFEELYRTVKSGQTLKPGEKIDLYLKMQTLYRAPLLQNSAGEYFIVQRSVYYHDMYIDSVFSLIELLKEEGRYEDIVRVCKRAMEVELFDERLHMELMMALLKLGKNREALSQYYYTTGLQHNQLGLELSPELKEFYKTLAEADQDMEQDIALIALKLLEGADAPGAFICDYGIFKDIYQLQKRLLVRTNMSIFLALLSVRNTGRAAFERLYLDKVMKRLQEICVGHLRRCDTVSRYSATQYALLLPSVTYDSGRMVMERVKELFYKEYDKTSVFLSYKLYPLSGGEEKK